jgi:hypothetical protein
MNDMEQITMLDKNAILVGVSDLKQIAIPVPSLDHNQKQAEVIFSHAITI